jgi:hypothetical protein
MTKQMKAAMAAMLMVGALPLQAQQSQTDVVKVAPGQKKTTTIHRKNGATDTVVSEGVSSGTHKPVHRAVTRKAPVESQTTREMRELREKQAAQQAEIDQLIQANAAKDAALQQANAAASTAAQQAAAAQQQAAAATSQAQSVNATVQTNTDAVQQLKSTVGDLQTTNAGLASTISANKLELNEKIDSPTVIRYKGVTITPVAFFAFEGVYRNRAVNSDINTPFNTIPFPGSNEGHISELNFSGRQSRIGGLFEGKAKDFKLSGYFESDFLSAGVTSNNNQSNSYTLRVRQIWGKAETQSGFAVTGGQTWSLVTEDGKSTDARTEKLPNTIDSQYMVGFSWARQPGIRLQQKFGGADQKTGFTLAMSLEQAQTQLATSANAPANFIFGGIGVGGGLYNAGATDTVSTSAIGTLTTYANNVAPDVMVKLAWDAPKAHVEIGGLARFFRDEYYPLIVTTTGTTVTVANSTNIAKNTKVGGGAFGSIRVSPSKFMDIAVQAMGGDGVGRYGSSQLGDVVAKPDGTLEPIRNYHGMFSLETHPAPKLDIFAYYGGEYAQRTTYVNPTGTLEGYGVPNANDTGCYALTLGTTTANGVAGSPGAVANCASPTKTIEEGMFGFTYRAVNSPRYGRLQYSATYSYFEKTTWTGVLSGTYGTASDFQGSGRATNGMVHVGMRYYIP